MERKDTYYIPSMQQTVDAGEYAGERDIEIQALKRLSGKNNNAFIIGMRNLDEPVNISIFDGYLEKKSKEQGMPIKSSSIEAAKGFGEGLIKAPIRWAGYAATNTLPLIAKAATSLYALSGAAGSGENADKWVREANKGIEAWTKEVQRITGIEDASTAENIVGNALGSVWGSVAIGGIFGKGTVAPMFGVSATQDTYVRQREAGTEMGESLVRGAIHGTGEAALERLQFNRIFGSLAKKSKPIAIVKDLLENAVQEGLQQANEIGANWNIDERSLDLRGLISVLQEVGASMVGGAIASIGGSVGGNILNRKTINEVGDLMKKTGRSDEEIQRVKSELGKIVDTDELQQAANQVAKDELTTVALTYKEQAQAASDALVVGLEDTIKRNELVDMGGALSGDKTEGMPPLYQLGDVQVDTTKNPNLGMVLYQAEQAGKPIQTLGQVLDWTKGKLNLEQSRKMNTGITAVYNNVYQRLKAIGQDDTLADANARVRSAMAYTLAKNYDMTPEQADSMLGGIVSQRAEDFSETREETFVSTDENVDISIEKDGDTTKIVRHNKLTNKDSNIYIEKNKNGTFSVHASGGRVYVKGFGWASQEDVEDIAKQSKKFVYTLSKEEKSITKEELDDALSEYGISQRAGEFNGQGQAQYQEDNGLTQNEMEVADRNRKELGVDGAVNLFKRTQKMWQDELTKETKDEVKKMYESRIQGLQRQIDWLQSGGEIETKKQVDESVNKKAKEYFGTTQNTNEAAYIMSDGSMLDFSGKKFGGPSGTRTLDHRQISEAFEESGFGVGMTDFIDNGNIRYMPESKTFLLSRKPTSQQLSIMQRISDRANGEIIVECVEQAEDWGGDAGFYREYNKGSNFKNIQRDINTFFSRGVVPEITAFYQFGGENANLTPEQRSTRIKAEEMEKQGKNPEDIWKETFWMKDKDGKWKFEIDDSKAKLKESEGLAEYTKSVPLYKELSEKMNRKYELENLGQEGTKQYKDIKKRLDELSAQNIMFMYETKLSDLLDHKELYKMYPALRSMVVSFEELNGLDGAYSYADNQIKMNQNLTTNKEEMLKTLMHEIQHYIQRVEDFARGGIEEEFTEEIMNQIKEQERILFENKQKERYIAGLTKYVTKKQAEEIIQKTKEMDDAFIKELESGDKDTEEKRIKIENEWKETLKKYGITEEQASDAMFKGGVESRKRYNAISSLQDPVEFYNRLLGEIEARNTENRLSLSKEGRREKPPFMNREYIGEEIIVTSKGDVVVHPTMASVAEQQRRGAYYQNTIYLFENANESTFVHEMAHSYMDVLERLSQNGNTKAQSDLNVIRNWLGKKQGQAFTQADWERFARGFEMYMREGKSPNQYLGGEKGVFARFRDWLMHIYAGIKTLRVKNEKGVEEPVRINNQIRRFYDEMLGGTSIDEVFYTAEKNQQSLEVLDNKLKQLAEAQQKLAEEKAKLVREMANNVKPDTTWANVKDWGKNVWESAKELPTNVLQSSYERLAKIDSRLGLLVQKAEQSQGLRLKKWADEVQPFYEAFNKLSNDAKAKVQYFLLNQQWGDVEEILGKDGTEAVHGMLEEIYNELQDSGVEVGYRDNYFPRAVLDYDGLLQEMGLTYPSLRKEMEEALGKDSTPQEQAEWLDKHIMGFKGTVSTSGNRNTKERKLDLITDRMAKYYKPSMETLVDYMNGMAKLLSMREAFGKDIEYKESTAEESIGKIINRLFGDNKFTKKEIDEVRDVLSALYLPNGMGNKFLQAMRQYGYATKLSYSTTVRQFADIGMMIKVNGVLNTLDALFHPDKRITLENLGIDPLGEEFQTSKTDVGGRLANISTKWKGINWADAVMKNAFLRGKYKDLQNLAKTPEKFHEKYDSMFGDETDTIIKDLNADKISEPVKVLLFHEISKIQPISRSSMPTAYLSNPNGRMFYMFKTFSLHRAEYMVGELADDFRRNDYTKAGKDIMADVAVIGWEGLVELLITFLKYGWQAFAAEAVLETFAGSGLGVFGLNKHQALQISRGQIGDFFQQMVGVGTPIDDIGYLIRHYDDDDKLLRAFLPDMIIEPLVAGPKELK